MFLGVDIGGTFTDLVLLDEEGELITTKALSTPGELEVGVFNAVQNAAEQKGMTGEELLARVKAFGHGTTQATNAVIERTGARTGLLATRGFGDTLAIQRLMGFTAGVPSDRLGWYSKRRHPQPIVPRRLVREIRERVDHAGRVLAPIDEEGVRCAVRELLDAGVETFAVAFLWSFRNPEHERIAARIIREMAPNAYVSISSDVAPVIGEYERTATAALNSYLAPKVVSYLDGIEQMLRKRGFNGAFSILEFGRRRHACLRCRAPSGDARDLRSDRRRDGFGEAGPAAWLQEHHHHRHGRHLLRRGDRGRRETSNVDQA